MFGEIIEIINSMKGFLKILGPVIVFIFSLITAASIIRWGTKINVSIHAIFKKPGLVIFWIIILFIFSVAYFSYVHPLFY